MPKRKTRSSTARSPAKRGKQESVSKSEEIDVEQSDSVGEEDEVTPGEPRFVRGDRILARDEDGMLYEGIIRRSLWGVHHHKQVQVGMVANPEELQALLEQGQNGGEDEAQEEQPCWHYFVHYLKWKVNWDRWVSDDDVLDITPQNIEMAERIADEHRTLQRQFKAKLKSKSSRRIDGGAFLKAWRLKLDEIVAGGKKTKRKKRKTTPRSSKATLEREVQLRTKDSLTQRKPIEIQQIALGFGLKRVLVEEWEILTQFEMVHCVPAKVTIRQALDEYLMQTKGIPADLLSKNTTVVSTDTAKEEMDTSVDKPDEPSETASADVGKENNTEPKEDETEDQEHAISAKEEQNPAADEQDRQQEHYKEWMDMADGIAMLFEQALPFRLLYSTEQLQLTVLEGNDSPHSDTPKSELYGCEHLLRLFCKLPTLLHDYYSFDDDDLVKSILAKVNDLVRYLQKNQSRLFSQSYRKANDAERKVEAKLAKRLERAQRQEVANK